MGFYGTLTSGAKTNLQIDRRFSNRKAMMDGVKTDGIYAGRYVLVEYSQLNNEEKLTQLYYDYQGTKKFSTSTDFSNTSTTIYDNDGAYNGVLYRVIINYKYGLDAKDYQYELYVGDSTTKENNYGIRKASDKDRESNAYINNYLIDKGAYGDIGQGYDSTVWQKIYEGGEPTYINIASLNSVIPTFTLTVDEPTPIPETPHFSENSSNIVYDLHVQPSWGFRVAASAEGSISDEFIKWNTLNSDGKIFENENPIAGAIYYNKAGFDKDNRSFVEGVDNYIKIEPTGRSGRKYNTSEIPGELKYEEKEDIQELRISLPAIGNMVSDGWDVIHGSKRDDNPIDSLQGKLKFFQGEDYTDADGNIITKGLQSYEIPVQSETTLIGLLINREYENGEIVNTDDDWISTNIDLENRKISILHKIPKEDAEESTTAGVTEAQTPKFGETFAIPYVTYDDAGHISGSDTVTVTIPEVQVANSIESGATNNATVLTSIGWDVSNDKLTSEHQNVGSLLLTGYEPVNESASIASSDNINSAFGKLQKSLDEEIERAGAAEQGLSETIKALEYNDTINENQVVYGITQEAGKITAVERKNLSALKLGGFNTDGQITSVLSNTQTLAGALNALENRIEAEVSNLKYEDSAANITTFVSKVTQENGVISVERTAAGTLKLGEGYKKATEAGAVAADSSINSAFGQLEYNLEAEVARAKAEEAALGKRVDLLYENTDTEKIDSIVEFVSWMEGHGTDAASMAAAIEDNSEAIENLKNGSESTIKDLDDSIATLKKDLEDISGLVGETSISDQIDTKLADYVTTNNLTTTLNNYYTKEEIGNELSNYSDNETITKNYYNKIEINTTLESYALKQEIPTDFYSKSETYTQDEVNNLINQTITIISKNKIPEEMSGTVSEILTKLLTRIVALENPDNPEDTDSSEDMEISISFDTTEIIEQTGLVNEEITLNYNLIVNNATPTLTWSGIEEDEITETTDTSITFTKAAAGTYPITLTAAAGDVSATREWTVIITEVSMEEEETPEGEEVPTE